jgi:hypothetical protein
MGCNNSKQQAVLEPAKRPSDCVDVDVSGAVSEGTKKVSKQSPRPEEESVWKDQKSAEEGVGSPSVDVVTVEATQSAQTEAVEEVISELIEEATKAGSEETKESPDQSPCVEGDDVWTDQRSTDGDVEASVVNAASEDTKERTAEEVISELMQEASQSAEVDACSSDEATKAAEAEAVEEVVSELIEEATQSAEAEAKAEEEVEALTKTKTNEDASTPSGSNRRVSFSPDTELPQDIKTKSPEAATAERVTTPEFEIAQMETPVVQQTPELSIPATPELPTAEAVTTAECDPSPKAPPTPEPVKEVTKSPKSGRTLSKKAQAIAASRKKFAGKA